MTGKVRHVLLGLSYVIKRLGRAGKGFSRYVSTGELELLGCRVCAFSVLLPATMLPSIVTLVI